MPVYSTLSVVTPPASEPVTIAMARKHLRVDHFDDDDLIAMYLTSAREWIESYLGRVLMPQQLLWTTASAPYVGAAPFVGLPYPIQINPLWYPWPDALNSPVSLPRAPLISVDRVAYGAWGAPDTVVTGFQTDNSLGRIRFLYGTMTSGSRDHIEILFTAGYPTAAQIPQSIVFGLLMLLAHFYENRGDTPTEAPAAITRLLTMHRRLTFGG